MRIFFVANSSFAIYNFRRLLLEKLKKDGHDIYIIAPKDTYIDKFICQGFRYLRINMKANSRNPFRELICFLQIAFFIFWYRPNACLTFTVKPNLYVGIIRNLFNFTFIPNVTGLGNTFDTNKFILSFFKNAYQLAFSNASTVFFQNNENRSVFYKMRILRDQNSMVLPGSGVDLQKVIYRPKSFNSSKEFRFLFVGRLLAKKGISEYIKASLKLLDSQSSRTVCFDVIGQVYDGKIPGVDENQLNAVMANERFTLHGFIENTSLFFERADCVVLPSYYNEGVPKALIEALAYGCIIITTNRPGCREVLDQNVNGIFCKECDVNDLLEKMKVISQLKPSSLRKMSKESRKKSLSFDERLVVNHYLAALS